MLKQLARFRLHLFLGTAVALWFLLAVVPDLIGGQRFFPAFWAAIKEIRPVEWVMVFCVWLSLAFPYKPPQTKITTLGLTSQK